MGPSRPWRRQLLGTLQGQLQLATYLAVFVGFTGASIAGLWIGQRNLIDSTRRDLNQSAKAIQTCLREAALAKIPTMAITTSSSTREKPVGCFIR